MFTLENLTQDILDKAWDIWYRCGFPNDPGRYRYPTPTVTEVRRAFSRADPTGDSVWDVGIEGRLGIESNRYATLWIWKLYRRGVVQICFSTGKYDREIPMCHARNREIAESIERAWEEAGLPTRFE